jgi:hypothetical protein
MFALMLALFAESASSPVTLDTITITSEAVVVTSCRELTQGSGIVCMTVAGAGPSPACPAGDPMCVEVGQ